jgi:phosphomannomutase
LKLQNHFKTFYYKKEKYKRSKVKGEMRMGVKLKDAGEGRMLIQWNKLQNGTDIRGIALEGSEKEVNLTPEAVKFTAYGFVKWLEKNKNMKAVDLKIAVGMDSRLSGPDLKEAFIEGVTGLGCSACDCGICTTPAMFMTTVSEKYRCDGAVMITASHLPYYYNGLKFFTEEGGCEKEDIKNILSGASEKAFINSENKGKAFKIDFIEEYSKGLINMIRKAVDSNGNYNEPLSGFRIVVDAGNGAGGFFADKVLKSLGADVTGSQFLEPDGRFPNHIPNPEDKEAMESIRRAVLTNNADLGIIFDTDVDRAAVVDSSGMEINRNALIALISSIILEEHPGTTIVTDSITSTGLGKFISDSGGMHLRFKRGYKNVINEAKRLNGEDRESWLAIETSGHAALKENYFLDDGAYLMAKILIKMAKLNVKGRKIQSLIWNLKTPAESHEFRLKIRNENFKEYGAEILKALEKYTDEVEGWGRVPENYEGIRVSCGKFNGNAWFLLRLSLHEPLLALNLESDSMGGTKMIRDKLITFFSKYDELDIAGLK